MKAVLQFKDYHVVETIYKFDPYFEEDNVEEDNVEEDNVEEDNVDIKPRILFKLSVNNDNNKEAIVGLGIEFGDIEMKNAPIYVKARVLGEFVINEMEQDLSEEQIIAFYKRNGVAILFPYLRSLVSDLTSKGSETPIIIPTMNVAAMVNKIKENFDE